LNLSIVQNEFFEKIAKAKSERMSALSNALQAEGEFNKLSIAQSNYVQRSKFYYIKAPQDGYVTKAIINGIGETVKEGESIFSFVPSKYDLAVEMYVRPIDLPLIKEGRKVQLQFDGWPALVFNGWPDMSFGTFTGRIVAFDKAASPNGKFRLLIAPDPETPAWPSLLRLGTGTYGIALLNNVPIWYELWRNLNGFPPDFYTEEVAISKK
jgi:multidrug resistance efflux pump